MCVIKLYLFFFLKKPRISQSISPNFFDLICQHVYVKEHKKNKIKKSYVEFRLQCLEQVESLKAKLPKVISESERAPIFVTYAGVIKDVYIKCLYPNIETTTLVELSSIEETNGICKWVIINDDEGRGFEIKIAQKFSDGKSGPIKKSNVFHTQLAPDGVVFAAGELF